MILKTLKQSMPARIALYSLLAAIAFGICLYVQSKPPPAHDFAWALKAAEKGDRFSQHQLGLDYDFGEEGAQKDPAKAAYWYHKAAEQGDDLAQYNLGTMYMKGRGVQTDYSEALIWLTKAADQGRAAAQCNLGNLY